MSQDLASVTVVYPIPHGDPVTYINCEIDELDSEGNLRLTRFGGDEDAIGVQYAVWRPGTFSRAETTRKRLGDGA